MSRDRRVRAAQHLGPAVLPLQGLTKAPLGKGIKELLNVKLAVAIRVRSFKELPERLA